MSVSCPTILILSAILPVLPTSKVFLLLPLSFAVLSTTQLLPALRMLFRSVSVSSPSHSRLSVSNSTFKTHNSKLKMPLPVNLDEYSRYVTLDDSELRDLRVSDSVLNRLHRIRGLYAYWLQFPSKSDNDLVQYDINMFKASRSLAYEDLHLTKVLLGNMQQTTKEFMRWKINKSVEQDIAAARKAGEWRAVAALSKVLVANNRTDKDDEPDLEFDKIVPQNFEPTDDPTVLGIERIPDLRGKIRALYKRYSNTMVQDADFEEIKDEPKPDEDD